MEPDLLNPFLNQNPLFNTPLNPDLCHDIHFAACQSAICGPPPPGPPADLPVKQLQAQVVRYGREILIAHPAHLETVFQGITLSTYRAIERLFNTPLRRTPATVFAILRQMAHTAGQPPPPYEGVWAICLYLQPGRDRETAPQVELLDTAWHIFVLTPKVEVQRPTGVAEPHIVGVARLDQPRIVSFRLCDTETDYAVTASLAIYEALVTHRQPAQLSPFGVVWRLPSRLICPFELPAGAQVGLNQLGITLQIEPDLATLLPPDLATSWHRDLTGQRLTADQLTRMFDYYLSQRYGDSPGRAAAAFERDFYGLVGVNRDPGSLVPALRALLPRHEARVSPAGEVAVAGLHFESPLLVYFPDQPVTVQLSPSADSTAWIYLDGTILGEAYAGELRRSDGTYRRYRLQRSTYA